MPRPRAIPSAGLLVLLLSPGVLPAQSPAAGTVSGTGTAEIRRQPETLRVQFEVQARGKTLREALDKLKARREEVRSALVGLGARKEAVVFGDPGLTGEASARNVQIEQLIHQRNQSLGRPKPKAGAASVVTATVRADFPLPAGGEEEAIGGPGQPGQPAPGEPVFVYVCKISEEERTKATAEAFAKAKREAERLARAAGAELGGLHHLANQFSPGGDWGELSMLMRRGYDPGVVGRSADSPADDEAVGVQAGKVSLHVAVTAQFTLKPP